MGITKSDNFSAHQNNLANQLKALAHPARIAIIEFLLNTEGCICGDIVNELTLSQATVSQHLRELKEAGLIKGSIEGKSICYCIDQENFTKLTNKLNEINNALILKNNKCC
jgi:DNA-binding transcriptional ArsR family regulator